MIRDAVTYKLADQVLNVRPDNRRALTPTDVFPAGVVDPTDWRRLIFGGWWNWVEQWGQLVSVVLGLYYLHSFCRAGFTALFSCRVLYQEHGLSPSLLWGLGLGRKIFPMRFYRRWRKFQANTEQGEARSASFRPRRERGEVRPVSFRGPKPRPLPRPDLHSHEYLVVGTEPGAPSSKPKEHPLLTEAEQYVLMASKKNPVPIAPQVVQPLATLPRHEIAPVPPTTPAPPVTPPPPVALAPSIVPAPATITVPLSAIRPAPLAPGGGPAPMAATAVPTAVVTAQVREATDYTVTPGPIGDAIRVGRVDPQTMF